MAQRLRVVARIKDVARGDDITPLLTKDAGAAPEAVFSQNLDTLYGAALKELEQNAAAQREQLDAIRECNRKFVAARGTDAAPLQQACQRVARAAAVFQEVIDNLREGVTFYTELQSMCMRHKRQAEDFCFARDQERRELVGQPALAPPPAYHPYGASAPALAPYQQPHQQPFSAVYQQPYQPPPPAYQQQQQQQPPPPYQQQPPWNNGGNRY